MRASAYSICCVTQYVRAFVDHLGDGDPLLSGQAALVLLGDWLVQPPVSDAGDARVGWADIGPGLGVADVSRRRRVRGGVAGVCCVFAAAVFAVAEVAGSQGREEGKERMTGLRCVSRERA